jgi:hypothetical protein
MKFIGKVASALVKRSLLVMGILCVCVLVLSVMAGAIYARGGLQTFPGTTAPGAHEFWDKDAAEAEFCTQCHETIAAELSATATAGTHPVTACLGCHASAASGHSALPTLCVTCHGTQGTELLTDAHVELLADMGEDETTASSTCKACHTKQEINITTTLQDPLELTQD